MKDKTPASDETEPSGDLSVESVDADLESDVEDSGETAVAEAEAVVAAAKPVRRKVSQAPVRKKTPTPKRTDRHSEAFEHEGRVGPVTFVKQSVGELKKVNWPTGTQLRQYFFAVLIFVLFVIAYVGLLDLGFSVLLLKLFG